MRGHKLGRVLWQGAAEPDTASPEPVNQRGAERVLRAPAAGTLRSNRIIGEIIRKGEVIAEVDGVPVTAVFDGILRGLIHPGVHIESGTKIGDLDPRQDPTLVERVSDKALAVGGGVLQAILSRPEIREKLWI